MLNESLDGHHYRPGYNPAFLAKAHARRKAMEAEAKKRRDEAARQQRLLEAEMRAEQARKLKEERIKALQAKSKGHREQEEADWKIALLQNAKYSPSLKTIINRITKATGTTWAEVMSARRENRIVFARQAICYWAVRLTTLSYPAIGRRLGRDHTTCLFGAKSYPAKRAAQGRTLRPARG